MENTEWLATLSEKASKWLNDFHTPTLPDPEPGPEPLEVASKYYLVVCRDGEFPYLLALQSLEELVETILPLDGQDVVAIPFSGDLLPFSRAPFRWMVLPDQSCEPLFEAKSQGLIIGDLSKIDLDMQDDFYLGPAELAVDTDPAERDTD